MSNVIKQSTSEALEQRVDKYGFAYIAGRSRVAALPKYVMLPLSKIDLSIDAREAVKSMCRQLLEVFNQK